VATVAFQPSECVVLRDVSWDFYERLLAEVSESPGTRITFDQGLLQIMVISAGHDKYNRSLQTLVQMIAFEMDLNFCCFGSMTFKRPDLRRGFEPDSCFYFQHADAMRPRMEIDPEVDPPPELILEIDITRDSFDRFPIFAAMSVPEVWRYSDSGVTFFSLEGASYQAISRSKAIPILTPETATHLLEEMMRLRPGPWRRKVQDWVRQQIGA